MLKEWAYAGAFFTYTGAIISHLTTGYGPGEVGLLAAAAADTPGLARPLRARIRRGRSDERRWPAR